MADEVVKRKVQVLTAGGAPLETHTAIFIRKEGNKVRFITAEGKTFEMDASRVQISDPLDKGKVTKKKSSAPSAPATEAPRVGRENTIRGMTPGQKLLDAGNAMQRRIYRGLKRTEGWYSLTLAERVEINVKALKKAGIAKDLIPGVIDQMGRQYFSGKGTLESARAKDALAVLERWAGKDVTGGVKRVITRGVDARKEMGGGNVYTPEGKVEKRTGKSRREIIKKGKRGGSSRVATPSGGFAAKGKEVTTAREAALAAATRVTEGLARIDETKGNPRMSGKKAPAGKYPEGAVERKVSVITEQRVVGETPTGDPITRPVTKKITLMFKDGMYYVPDADGKITGVKKKDIPEWFSKNGEVRKVQKRSSSKGTGKATMQTELLTRESRIGARMNDERLVTIANELIQQARRTGNVPKEGGYTALLMDQPQFKGIDPKDLRRIIALAKSKVNKERVEKKLSKKRGVKPVTNKRTKLSPTGRDITDESPRTKKEKKTAAAVKAAEEQLVREDLTRKDASKKDRRGAALRGEAGKGITPAKPISRRAAQKMEQEIAAGKKPTAVFKPKTVKSVVGEAAAAGRVTIKEPRLNKKERAALSVLEGIPDRKTRLTAADAMGISTKVRAKAMSKNLLSLAGMYGANYILSQLGEEAKKRGKR